MEYVITFILTLLFAFGMIKLIQIKKDNQYEKMLYRQSDMHNILKHFFDEPLVKNKKSSQLTQRIEQSVVNVIIIDDKAYWITENIFYTADVINQNPVLSTAKPVDTSNLSKEDLDKLMFIVDNLNRGKQNDDSSPGN